MKLCKNGASFFVVLPKQIVLAKGWEIGDRLKAEIDNKGNIVIKPQGLPAQKNVSV